jgi:CRISPR system Cascade subunit CasB
MSKSDDVYRYVASAAHRIHNSGNNRAAALAKLRRGIGKPPGASPEVWEYTLAELPENLAGKAGEPSEAEWAIHLALTLFALHQQGNPDLVIAQQISFGQAVSWLIDSNNNNESGIKARFDAALTAKGINEFANHARSLVQLMKAKKVSMDYPLFAKDLFDYQFVDSQDRVRLRWGEAYYRVNNSTEQSEEGEQQ